MKRINNHEDWEQYKKIYKPLSYNDSTDTKEKWFNNLLNPEPVCSMCREKDTDVIYDKKIW